MGSPFKKPKYLYHSAIGGSCWGGSAPPIPKVIVIGSNVIFEAGTTTGPAPWGEASLVKVTAGAEDSLKIFMSNAGCATLDYATLKALSDLNKDKKGKNLQSADLESEMIEVVGMRYPGDPLLVARLDIAIIPEGSFKKKTDMSFSVVSLGMYTLQPVLLSFISGQGLLPESILPSLSHETSLAIFLVFHVFNALVAMVCKFTAKFPDLETFRVIMKSYEECEGKQIRVAKNESNSIDRLNTLAWLLLRSAQRTFLTTL